MSAAIVPTGTMTFFFTDVEGSTRLWETNHNAMALALARHDGILRAAIVEHGGHVFKTGGDAFFAAFQHASDGLAAALTVQRRLATVAWGDLTALSVRMALHTGIAEARDDDYFGPTLNRTARLLAAGYGGQMLLSKATRDALLGASPADVTLRDLGERRLKDLTLPEQIFQVIVPDLPDTFPPLLTLDARQNNLPAQQTPLIGRDAELETARQRLRQPDLRVLTLTGPGGTGKTRLSLQLAADVIDDYTHGVWFVSLAAVTDAEMVATEIAEALGVREEGGQSAEASLIEHLRERQLLLILDNFEQVLAAATLVGRLLAACPNVTILITSRAALRVYGEHEYPVPPLALPERRRRLPLDQLATYPAVDLFVQRSRAVKPDFALTAENALAVADICVRLDGLPLAIELAASRSKILAPQAMLARLDSRLKLLTGGARDRPERQQTLRAAIAWSHDLLEAEEQTLFGRLSIFTGSFTLEAAEQVVGDELDVFDGVASLVDKSLVRQEDGGTEDEPRFAMLATIREFGQEQLAASGEADLIARRYADYFLALAEEAEPALIGADQATWLHRLAADHDNLRASLSWWLERDDDLDRQAGTRLAGALWRFWRIRGHLSEGRRWLELALDRTTSTETLARFKALTGAGMMAVVQGDYDQATLRHEAAHTLATHLDDRRATAEARRNLGMVADLQGDYDRAIPYYDDALTLFRQLNDKRGIAGSLHDLGTVALYQGNYALATAQFEESLANYRAIGDNRGTTLALTNLGILAFWDEQHELAAERYEECLALWHQLGDEQGIATTVCNLGEVLLHRGDLDGAATHLMDALDRFRELGDRQCTADVLHNLGRLSVLRNEVQAAESYLAEGLRLAQQVGYQACVPFYLEELAGLVGGDSRVTQAARWYGAAAALRETIGTPIPAAYRTGYDRGLATVRARLSEESFAAAWAEGGGSSLDGVIDDALATLASGTNAG